MDENIKLKKVQKMIGLVTQTRYQHPHTFI